ncbi:monovalent cation/H(+) antiporter subunit G [Streptococcus hyovaginalis]
MSENNLIELISVLLIFCGAIFCFLSSLGLIRLPDVYTKIRQLKIAGLLYLFLPFIYELLPLFLSLLSPFQHSDHLVPLFPQA